MTDKEYLTKVGIEIKVARIRKGMSTKDICQVTGLNDNTLNYIERGKKDAHILTYKRICNALGMEMKDFL